MLKKLAKYGNSMTLVIDKAILELLNMDETTIVKLQTDGKSLIITPVLSNTETKKISYDNLDTLQVVKESFEKKLIPKELKNETIKDAQKEFQEAFAKHSDAFNKFNKEILLSKPFQDALARLSETIDPISQAEKYIKEFNNLKIQFCPELGQLQKEIDEIQKKYNSLSC